jgi:hypothetical protein
MGFIYAVRSPNMRDNRIKIGFSTEPKKRFQKLKTGLTDLEVIDCWPGTKAEEKHLHELFASRRVAGEWFVNVSLKEINCIAAMARRTYEKEVGQQKTMLRIFDDAEGYDEFTSIVTIHQCEGWQGQQAICTKARVA